VNTSLKQLPSTRKSNWERSREALSLQGFPVSIKHAQNDDGAVFFDGKMDGIGERIDGLDADIIVSAGWSVGQAADLVKVDIEGVGKLEAQAVGAVVIVL